MSKDVYPVTIISARYAGIYEGGPWCAFNCYHAAIPDDADGDDTDCWEFWERASAGDYVDGIICASGDTPDEAFANLLDKRA